VLLLLLISIHQTEGKQMSTKQKTSVHTVTELKAASHSANTKRSYAQAEAHFLSWGGSIPCSAEMLAEYIACMASCYKVASIEHRIIALHHAHVQGGHVTDKQASPAISPLVKQTMKGIRRTLGTAQRRVKALVKDDLLETLVLSDQQQPMKAARDKALLLVGFAGAFRRSELVGIKTDDLEFTTQGCDILLRRSKTDQEGEGRTVSIPYASGVRCPVKALKHWMEVAGINGGAVFRSVSRYDKVSRKPLGAASVALIIKSSVARLYGKGASAVVSGHSLRAGYCTQAALVGLPNWQTKLTTGHKSDATLALYNRPVERRKVPSLL
jgi:integrase